LERQEGIDTMFKKLIGFDAEVTLNGKDHRVQWCKGTLAIFGVDTEEEALAVLGGGVALDVAKMRNALPAPAARAELPVKDGADDGDDVDEVDAAEREAMREPAYNGLVCVECGEPQFRTPAGDSCANGHGGAEGVMRAPPEEEEVEETSTAGAKTGHTSSSEPNVSAPPREGKKRKPDVGDVAAAITVEALSEQTTIRGVLKAFIAAGITNPEEIIATCKSMRVKVPVLARVTNIEERVARSLEALQGG
jgi:hypothetical protein